MPNKEKSVKTVQKSNENDAIRTQPMTNDVITTDVKKGANNKKREKHKCKETTNNANAVNENGLNATPVNEHADPDIRAVSEELLRRLQCNGTSISVRRSNDSGQQISSKQGDNGSAVQSQQMSKQLNYNKNNSNNNNNNSKAHNKNQSEKIVNNSSNNVANCSEAMQTNVQCNGTHSTSMEHCAEHQATGTNTSTYLSSPGTSTENGIKSQVSTEHTEATVSSKDSVLATASCSSQQHNNLPSTSTSNPSVYPESTLPRSALSVESIKTSTVEVKFKEYENELQMPDIMRVIQRELSEPYSIYTYRYFIHNWPKLCFLAMDGDNCIGAIVCKLDIHRQMTKRGYIAMLAVDAAYRKLKVGTTLVQKAIEAMLEHNADEVVLETEITNIPALRLYENLGFVRDKRLFDYYLNGVDALRLKLWFK
ncbi:N-alpha-acetyltransferase 30A [Contarinia nasturtii]|uniref:N-alpha-acetyltransferase 30A n=1 Tax=Contarinia nasturtii TaxID=265458 RepID=UPI0012D49CFD|nr:N-alpha-acetyltransferase 30A [Contarinia nasturtii]